MFYFSKGSSNQGGVGLYMPFEAAEHKLITAMDLSPFVATHYMTLGSRKVYGEKYPAEMIRHARIFTGRAFLATDDLTDLYSGR